MAHAISAGDVDLLKDDPTAPEAADGRPDGRQGGGTGPLLRAVALQRPASELIELVALLNEGDQSSHAQEILNTAATLRPVEELAAMVPLLGDAQAACALQAAAVQRPVEELARLVEILNDGGQSAHAREVLDTAATLRPVEELARLVGHLYGTPGAEPAAQQVRWKLRR